MTDIRVAVRRKTSQLQRRRKHIKKSILGTPERPRMVVYRSNKHISVQIVDDLNHRTIAGCSTLSPAIKDKLSDAKTKIDRAKVVGEHIAALAKEKGVDKIFFDRNGRKYHGRIKSLADGARSGGLLF